MMTCILARSLSLSPLYCKSERCKAPALLLSMWMSNFLHKATWKHNRSGYTKWHAQTVNRHWHQRAVMISIPSHPSVSPVEQDVVSALLSPETLHKFCAQLPCLPAAWILLSTLRNKQSNCEDHVYCLKIRVTSLGGLSKQEVGILWGFCAKTHFSFLAHLVLVWSSQLSGNKRKDNLLQLMCILCNRSKIVTRHTISTKCSSHALAKMKKPHLLLSFCW